MKVYRVMTDEDHKFFLAGRIDRVVNDMAYEHLKVYKDYTHWGNVERLLTKCLLNGCIIRSYYGFSLSSDYKKYIKENKDVR